MEIINLKSRNYLLSLIRNIFCNVGDKIILPYFNNLKSSEITTKDDNTDFVTLADKKSENYIKSYAKIEDSIITVTDFLNYLENLDEDLFKLFKAYSSSSDGDSTSCQNVS